MAKQPLTKGTHGTKGKTFEKLTFDEQSKSINGTIQNLKKAINANVRRSKNENETRIQRIRQVAKLLSQL